MNLRPLLVWLKTHWARALLMVLYFFLGGAVVSLFYTGLFNGNSSRVASILGVLGGLFAAALWLWQERLAPRRARVTAWLLVAVPVLALAAFAALHFGMMSSLGQYPPRESDYLTNYNRLTQAVERNYPYFAEKQVDWPQLVARYRLRVQSAASDQDYYAAVAELLAELNDGHTGLANNNVLRYGVLVDVDGHALLDVVGETAKQAGLQVGDEVVSVGGLSIDQAVDALPAPLRSGPTPWNRRVIALSYLLRVPEGGKLDVDYLDAGGQQHAITLVPSKTPTPAGSSNAAPPVVTARQLPSGVGVITVSRLWGSGDLTAEFDRALDGLMTAPAIILDLRGNGGGDSLLGDHMVGRFLSSPFAYGSEYYRQRTPIRFWRTRGSYHVEPRAPLYTGPLAVLTDAAVFSSGEMMVTALKDSGRAVTIGQTTGGGSGNPIHFKLIGGASARFSTGAFYRNNGELVEGRGISPDIPVVQTLTVYREGRDLPLEAAEKYLLGQ